jgi:hypothetical protein
MDDLVIAGSGVTHQMYDAILRWAQRFRSAVASDAPPNERDSGAVSLEQVLWFVAAGVSVAVIAAILWGQIRDQAEQTPVAPSAP